MGLLLPTDWTIAFSATESIHQELSDIYILSKFQFCYLSGISKDKDRISRLYAGKLNKISFPLYCTHICKFWYRLNMASFKRNIFLSFFPNIPNEKYTIWAILYGIFLSIIWQL